MHRCELVLATLSLFFALASPLLAQLIPTNGRDGRDVPTLAVTSSITQSWFESKVDFTTGSFPLSVAIGDLDGDSKADVAVTNYSSNTVSVFRNTSTRSSITTSSFTSKMDFTTGKGPDGMAIGDLDADGKLDLVLTNRESNTVSVFRNTSAIGPITSSSFAARVDFTTGSGPSSVAIGDVDGDGKPDLAVANGNGNTVSVFRNTSTSGSISFASKVDFTTGDQVTVIAIGDLDGDAKPELVVANIALAEPEHTLIYRLSVFRNTSTSGSITSSSFAAKVDFTTAKSPWGVAIEDFDGDAKPDVAIVCREDNTLSVFHNRSTSGSITSSSFAPKVDFATGSFPVDVAIGDLDGDGKPDLAVVNRDGNTVSVFRNTTTSGSITSSSFASKEDFSTGSFPLSIAIRDLDGDGGPDLAVANYYSNTVSVLRNKGQAYTTKTYTSEWYLQNRSAPLYSARSLTENIAFIVGKGGLAGC
jgi:hypothetical protein